MTNDESIDISCGVDNDGQMIVMLEVIVAIIVAVIMYDDNDSDGKSESNRKDSDIMTMVNSVIHSKHRDIITMMNTIMVNTVE